MGCSWLNISANFASAILVSVPKCAKGEAGVGLRRMCVRSRAASMTRSWDEVAGMVIRWGKNSTFSLWRITFVLVAYIE